MTDLLIKTNFLTLMCSMLMLLSVSFNASAQLPVEQNEKLLFAEIDDLLSLGVPGLALRRLQLKQPELLSDNVQSWLLWEKKRIQLMQKLQQWSLIVERIDQSADLWKTNSLLIRDESRIEITDQHKNWFWTQQIKAHLKLANDSTALSLLRRLLWSADGSASSDLIAMWRRLVIQSYLQLNKTEDAQRAMRRYQQDYSDLENEDGLQWTILQMQLLMRTSRYQEVVRALSGAVSDEEKALLLVAKLEQNLLSSQQIQQQLQKQLSNKDSSSDSKPVYDFVLLKSVIAEKNLLLQAQLIEKLLVVQTEAKIADVFFDAREIISADNLWTVYEKLGFESANGFELLQGDDDSWYLKASNLHEQHPMQAKALYVVLALNAQQQAHRIQAFEHLVKLLSKQEAGMEIVNALFMKSSRLADIEQVPVKIRYQLVDYALSHGDVKSAAMLMEKLQQAPDGEEAFGWNLRRARILVMGGQYQQGSQILEQLLVNKKQLTIPEIDQYMQVLFDLQAIEQHVLALTAFDKLQQYPLNEKLHREIAFWKAESYQAMGEFEQAAYLFLRSAKPLNNNYDPWFHTASFKAAESLAQARLIDDARRQYIKLLRITKNEARKSVIKQRLQQLRLLKSNKSESDL